MARAQETRVSIALNQTDEPGRMTRIVLRGSVDIGSVEELKAAFLDALAGGKEIEIAFEEVTGFDVAALQLLWAARRESKRVGLKLAITGLQTGVLKNCLAEVGMQEVEDFS